MEFFHFLHQARVSSNLKSDKVRVFEGKKLALRLLQHNGRKWIHILKTDKNPEKYCTGELG